MLHHDMCVIMLCSILLLGGKTVEKQLLSAEDGPIFILDLCHIEVLLSLRHELHVCTPPLLETEEDCSVGTQSKQINQCLHEQGKGRLKVDTVGSEYRVWPKVDYIL